MKAFAFLLLVLMPGYVLSQNIRRAEYFFDIDPGVGLATALPSFAFGDSVYFTASVSSTGLSIGLHQLYIRTADANGQWSLSEAKEVSVVSGIVNAEYFFDTDPGVGSGIPIVSFAMDDSVSIFSSISSTGLSF
ncbi:MAG: hypothetical protein ABI772_11295, partial [Bacteroidota bacterium]